MNGLISLQTTNIKKILIFLLFTIATTSANAIDCEMAPTRVLLSTNNRSVWICENDKCVHQQKASHNLQSQVDKLYTLGLTAVSTGKTITVKFNSNTDCFTLLRHQSVESHKQITQIWLNNF